MTWLHRSPRPRVAVVSDGSGHPVPSPASVVEVVSALADELRVRGRLDAEPVIVPARGAGLVETLEQLSDRYRAVFLVRTDPALAQLVSERAADGWLRPVVTEQDCAATALCAATLVHLRSIGRSPDVARVVVAGGAELPVLAQLLMIAGVYDVTTWQDEYAASFPLRRIVQDADVVVDLRPGSRARAEAARIALDRPDGSVLGQVGTGGRSLLAVGVLRVALACPPGSLQVGLSTLRACAGAIAQVTPMAGRRRLPERAIDDVVAAAVRRTIDPRLAGA